MRTYVQYLDVLLPSSLKDVKKMGCVSFTVQVVDQIKLRDARLGTATAREMS